MAALSERGRLARYATVTAIVAVIGALFVQRELVSGGGGARPDVAVPVALGILDAHPPKVGEPAPNFALATPAGRTVKLSDFRGKTVVLNFWATWCPPCRAEMPDFQRTWEERGADRGDLVVLAVNLQEAPGPVEGFVREFGLTFPIAMDRTGEVMQHYGLRGLPGTFFIDRGGVLRSQSLGPVFGDLLLKGIAAAEGAAAISR